MIVRSITVRNWRCYLNPVTVGPFDERLNVIHGPNATGKSTLFEALRRAFLDSHRVTGEAIEAVQSWGRGLAPEVMVEFAHNGAEYRITKQFLRNPYSRLERKEKGRFVPFQEGASADEWVRGVLQSRPPGRGPARLENWGLAQILWAPQGDLGLRELSEDVVGCIRASLGTQLAAGSGALEKRIEELYLQEYTPSAKKIRKEAALARMQKELGEITSRLNAARENLKKFGSACERVKNLRDQQAQAEREAGEVRKTLDTAHAQAEQYRALLAERDQRTKDAEAAEARYQDLKRRVDQIQAARREIAEAREQLGKLKAEMPVVEREIASRQRALAQARAAREDIRKNRRAAEGARTLAEEAHAFVENERKLAELRKTLASIEASRQALEALEKQRAALLAPDARTLKKIREAFDTRQEAFRNIQSALITLEIVPERETTVEVIEGQSPESKKVSRGTPIQIQGSPQVVVHLPGTARLRAWGPAQSIEQYRKTLANAEQNLRKLTEPFGTQDIGELERRQEEASELDKSISMRKTEIEMLSGGRPVPEISVREISKEISRLEGLCQTMLAHHPEWQNVSPDAEALSRAAKDALRSFSEKEEEAEAACDKAQNALSAAERRREKLSADIRAQEGFLSRSQSLLDGLTSDGKTDEERERRLTELAMEWKAARSRMREVEGQLSTFAPDTLSTVEKLERQLEALRETARKARDNANIEEGQLRALAAEGPYSEVARLEEEFTELERQVREEEVRTAALRLLYETVKQCRTEALSAVTGPVERAATRMLHRIAGERLGSLKMGEQFQPEFIHPAPDLPARLDSVSGGEWEQIHLVTRLALAEVLAGEERQLVVWDDVLAATDMGRLARVLTLIEEAADRLQMVILTCHPERYRGLEGAHFIDLDALVRTA